MENIEETNEQTVETAEEVNNENTETQPSQNQIEKPETVAKENNTNKQSKFNAFKYRVNKYFKVTERGSSFKQEFIGGLVNFLVISYVMVVIPGIFGGVGGEGLWKALFVSTILTSILSTLCMAFYVNLPIVLAPGIGLVSYAVQMIESGQFTFEQSMSICFMAGVVFVILTLTGLRKKILDAVPDCVKIAIPAGVGLFILNLGLNSSNSGILDLINGTATSYGPIVALVSFIIMIVLYIKNIKGGIFIGIAAGTVLDIIIKLCLGVNPFEVLVTNSWLPPFGEMFEYSFFPFDFAGLFTGNFISGLLNVLLVVFAVILIDLFDSVATLYATAERGGLIDSKGEVYNQNRAMMVDGAGAIVSTCFGLPNSTSYVESTAGISSGARTGLSGVFTSLFFFLSLFVSPLVMLIPIYATAPALVLVGLLMFDGVTKINFKDLSVSIPSMLTLIIMPLTSNITYGIAIGLISYTLIMLLTGKFKKINIFTYVITALFIVYFIMQYV